MTRKFDVARMFATPTTAALQAFGSGTPDARSAIRRIASNTAQKDALGEVSRALNFSSAIGANFPAILPMMSEEARTEVMSLMACVATAKDRKAIMEHPMCPAEVEANVAAYDEEIQKRAEARKAEKERIAYEKKRARYEKLKAELEAGDAAQPDAAE